jgi:hypothetical protein
MAKGSMDFYLGPCKKGSFATPSSTTPKRLFVCMQTLWGSIGECSTCSQKIAGGPMNMALSNKNKKTKSYEHNHELIQI